MNPRELIILVLGLAIVAVILRGLYVAMQARRGQIRLAIDKNIPQDIDLDALELAELPGGGARVVERSLESVNEQNSKLDAAEERAAALNLGQTDSTDDAIPVLMDAISLTSGADASTEPEYNPDFIEEADISGNGNADDELERDDSGTSYDEPTATDSWADQSNRVEQDIQEDYEAGQIVPEFGSVLASNSGQEESSENKPAPVASDTDDILFDYERPADEREEVLDTVAPDPVTQDTTAIDPMAQIAPDYPEEDHQQGSQGGLVEPGLEPDEGHQELGEEENGLESEEDRYFDQEVEVSDQEESINEPGQSFEEQLDEFSMSAGERIGYEEAVAPKQVNPRSEESDEAHLDEVNESIEQQSSLFDDDAVASRDEPHPPTEVGKPRSFFSVFKRKPKDVAITQEEEFDDEIETTSDTELSEHESDRDDAPESVVQHEGSAIASEQEAEPVAAQPTEVLVINVMAREGYAFAGDDLLQVLITAGLKFGEMNIFHHRLDVNNKNSVLFSVANVLNPGTFDLNNMNNFSTLGVSFFLALPTAINNLEAFETMLSVAQQVKAGLDGELKDDHRNVMTAQTIEHYRQRVRDFELRQLKAAGGRG